MLLLEPSCKASKSRVGFSLPMNAGPMIFYRRKQRKRTSSALTLLTPFTPVQSWILVAGCAKQVLGAASLEVARQLCKGERLEDEDDDEDEDDSNHRSNLQPLISPTLEQELQIGPRKNAARKSSDHSPALARRRPLTDRSEYPATVASKT